MKKVEEKVNKISTSKKKKNGISRKNMDNLIMNINNNNKNNLFFLLSAFIVTNGVARG